MYIILFVGLSVAIQLAHSLLRFPQQCMNADRLSTYNAAYNATSLKDAMKYEYENGIKVLQEESIPGECMCMMSDCIVILETSGKCIVKL